MSLFLSLVLFVAVTAFTPGGATALAATSGMRHGLSGSVTLLAGLIAGTMSLAAASAFGLGKLIVEWPQLRLALATLGTAYFVCLAVMIARSGAPDLAAKRDVPLGFFAGLLLLWLNPKAWTMTLGAAASFGALAADPVRLAVLLGAVFMVFSTAALTIWCLGGAYLARALSTPRQWRTLNLTLAGLLLVSIVPVWIDYL